MYPAANQRAHVHKYSRMARNTIEVRGISPVNHEEAATRCGETRSDGEAWMVATRLLGYEHLLSG